MPVITNCHDHASPGGETSRASSHLEKSPLRMAQLKRYRRAGPWPEHRHFSLCMDCPVRRHRRKLQMTKDLRHDKVPIRERFWPIPPAGAQEGEPSRLHTSARVSPLFQAGHGPRGPGGPTYRHTPLFFWPPGVPCP